MYFDTEIALLRDPIFECVAQKGYVIPRINGVDDVGNQHKYHIARLIKFIEGEEDFPHTHTIYIVTMKMITRQAEAHQLERGIWGGDNM